MGKEDEAVQVLKDVMGLLIHLLVETAALRQALVEKGGLTQAEIEDRRSELLSSDQIKSLTAAFFPLSPEIDRLLRLFQGPPQ